MESETKYKFKKDRYVKARGGSSEFLEIHCGQCQTPIALYQKDGPGRLLRMYLDRIFAPSSLSILQEQSQKTSLPNLSCPKCHILVGVPMVYQMEDRLAFRLIKGTFHKERSNGVFPRRK